MNRKNKNYKVKLQKMKIRLQSHYQLRLKDKKECKDLPQFPKMIKLMKANQINLFQGNRKKIMIIKISLKRKQNKLQQKNK